MRTLKQILLSSSSESSEGLFTLGYGSSEHVASRKVVGKMVVIFSMWSERLFVCSPFPLKNKQTNKQNRKNTSESDLRSCEATK